MLKENIWRRIQQLLLLFTLLHIVIHSCFDGIFGEQTSIKLISAMVPAVQLNRRKFEVVRNVCVLNSHCFFKGLSLHPFTRYRARGNGRATTERLKLRINDFSISNFNLQSSNTFSSEPGASSHHHKQEPLQFLFQCRRHWHQTNL